MIEIQIYQSLFGFAGAVIGALGAYYGVKEKLSVQLAIIGERADTAKASAKDAHVRIDDHISLLHSK